MLEQPEKWNRVGSEQIADCRVFTVREDICERASDGAKHNFFVVENPDWANVIALTKERNVILIEQFRHGVEEITLEIPGGMVDKEENAVDAAKRELLEETGFAAGEMIALGKSRPNPALQNNWIHHFLAISCEKEGATNFDQHESIVTKFVPLKEIEKLIENEQITHSLVLAAFYKLLLRKEPVEEKSKTFLHELWK
jgi:8-oxo-dGTP pyrophosphatase MutT (NUDIX family)